MREVKLKNCKIEVPKGTAFTYDTPPELPSGHMLTACIGKRGSGKTTSLVNLAKKMNYDRIFVISPTFNSNSALMNMLNIEPEDVFDDPDDTTCIDKIKAEINRERDELLEYQEKMKRWKELMRLIKKSNSTIPDDLLLEFYDEDDLQKPVHRWGGRRPFMLLIVDDCQGSKLFSTKKLDNMTIRHRHLGDFPDDQPSIGISIAYLCQNYKTRQGGLSRAIRNNITNAMFFRNKDKKELKAIAEEMAGEIDPELFEQVYEKTLIEPHDFLFVDLHRKKHHPSGFRRNLDTFIVP